MTPPPRRAASSPTASRPKPGTMRSSSSTGSTCRSSGSAGSPWRMRATKPRGTRSGKFPFGADMAAASGSPAASASRPSIDSSSRGSRTASRHSACQRRGAACFIGRGAAGIMSPSINAVPARPHVADRGFPEPDILAARAGGPKEYPMATLGMNDVKNGMKILVNNEPSIITETDYVKPGKGQAFTRVRYRQIRTGRVQEITMKSTDSVEAADVVDTDMQFLYADGAYWHFMDPETFEQIQADKAGVGDAAKWIKGEEEC